jgi:hypothetical protein
MAPPPRTQNPRPVLCQLALPLRLHSASAARSSSKELDAAMAREGLRKIRVTASRARHRRRVGAADLSSRFVYALRTIAW